MKRLLSALCLFVLATGVFADDDKKADDGKGSAKFQVTRLEIRKYPPPKPGTFMFMNNGVSMDVIVTPTGKYITGVDFKASKLESIIDDKKNNLFKKAEGFFATQSDWLNEFFTQYTPEGDAVTIQVKSSIAPGKGAEKLLLKASLVLKCGSEGKATEKKEIAMKANEEATIDSFKVKIGQFGNQFNVISTEENIKNIEVYDDKGKEIKVGAPGRNRTTKGDKTEYNYSFFLIQKLTKFSIKVNYFAKVESLTIPVDLNVGLGLE